MQPFKEPRPADIVDDDSLGSCAEPSLDSATVADASAEGVEPAEPESTGSMEPAADSAGDVSALPTDGTAEGLVEEVQAGPAERTKYGAGRNLAETKSCENGTVLGNEQVVDDSPPPLGDAEVPQRGPASEAKEKLGSGDNATKQAETSAIEDAGISKVFSVDSLMGTRSAEDVPGLANGKGRLETPTLIAPEMVQATTEPPKVMERNPSEESTRAAPMRYQPRLTCSLVYDID